MRHLTEAMILTVRDGGVVDSGTRSHLDDCTTCQGALSAAQMRAETIAQTLAALDGPVECSGLPVQRYGPEALSRTLGHEFEAVDFQHETHHTPTGATQQFFYGHFQRRTEHTP